MGKYYIRRPKNSRRLNEDDQSTQPANGQPANPQGQPNNAADQAPAANATTQPANGNPQQPPQDPKIAERAKAVTECVNKINEYVQKNEPYILIALNVVDLIKEHVKEFDTNNPEAKDAIEKWDNYKKQPTKESFDAFLNAFGTFGNGGQDIQNGQNTAQQPQGQQAPAQPQQPANGTTQAPAPTSTDAAAAVTTQAESEGKAMTFGQKLNENLQKQLRLSNAVDDCTNYRPFNY